MERFIQKITKLILIAVACVLTSNIAFAQIKLPDIQLPSQSQPSITSSDLEKVRTETLNIFEMYEQQIRNCQSAKEQIRVLSLQEIDNHLQELDRIKVKIMAQETTIDDLLSIKLNLGNELQDIKKLLKKVKRRHWWERSLSYATIVTLTILLTK